ncbi:transcription termination/antitermination NusG family protein [Pararhizobium mangrovi]|nr:transcription termination/antitermination NusG family protein [Pararhizobium mangrovi]
MAQRAFRGAHARGWRRGAVPVGGRGGMRGVACHAEDRGAGDGAQRSEGGFGAIGSGSAVCRADRQTARRDKACGGGTKEGEGMTDQTEIPTWYVARTRPIGMREAAEDKRFFRVERDLMEAGFDFYLPMEVWDQVHHRSKKLMQKRRPLVHGYVFLANVQNFWALSEVKTIGGIIGVQGRPLTMADAEVEIIRQAETAIFNELALQRIQRRADKDRLTQKRLSKHFPHGTPIEITDGFLKGEAGRVIRTTGRRTVQIALDRLANLGTIELNVDGMQRVA